RRLLGHLSRRLGRLLADVSRRRRRSARDRCAAVGADVLSRAPERIGPAARDRHTDADAMKYAWLIILALTLGSCRHVIYEEVEVYSPYHPKPCVPRTPTARSKTP